MSAPRYLLAIAIGPVQDFIAASRKARDLWAGSEFLSRLSRTAATTLHASGAELIFPTSDSLGQSHSVANKLLVVSERPAVDAEHARTEVQKYLGEQWDALIGDSEDLNTTIAAAQLKDFLEWYAAWVPLDDPDAYSSQRQRVERLVAGRKALRDFMPATGLDRQYKSSLDPSRESVIRRDRRGDLDVRSRYRLKGAEELDAISLIKRLDTSTRFVSTSRIAIDPLIRAMHRHDPKALEQLRAFAKDLDETELVESLRTRKNTSLSQFDLFPYDSQLFYASSADHAKALIEEDPGKPRDAEKLKQSNEVAACFLKTLTGFTDKEAFRSWREPPAYYAVLRADGDKMGAALNGLDTAKRHQRFSTQLGTFAAEARKIVANHQGGLIYSGGDDVLAFLPLDMAIPCAEALRQEFGRTMERALPDAQAGRPTLSVGMAIGHFAEHLQSILDRSKRAEDAAKVPRDAMAVEFDAHSGGGEARTIVHCWKHDDPLKYWAAAIELHRHGLFPDRGAYELDRLRREFIDALAARVFTSEAQADKLMIGEVKRILQRKKDQEGTAVSLDNVIEPLVGRLVTPGGDRTARDVLGLIVDELIVARRIARVLPDGTPGQPNLAIDRWNAFGAALITPVGPSGAEKGAAE